MKTYEITIILKTDNKVTVADINLLPDDVIDGFTLSRNNRLGDITEKFHFESAYIDKISQLKLLKNL